MSFNFRDAERRFWLEGAEAFRDMMHDDCLMVLPMPDPVLDSAAVLKGLEDFPRWDDVTFRSVRESGDEAAHVFACQAEGRRGEETYRAACLSNWVMTEDGWRLISHSQLPEGERT